MGGSGGGREGRASLSLGLGLGEDANHENRYHSAEVRRGMLAISRA